MDRIDEQPCGFCSGTGYVTGPRYDRLGRDRPEWPERIGCEYCGGTGRCEAGAKLRPQVPPYRGD